MDKKQIPLGPFELNSPLGQGGMGEVWQGIHVPQEVPVAVKVMTQKGALRDEYREAFRNEVRAVAGLDHPGIVMPLDYGEIPEGAAEATDGRLVAGSPYIVMELATRGNLKRFLRVIEWPELQLSLFKILDALAHAHANGIVHRDLKPANILVGCSGPSPGIKLTDFGLARALDVFDNDSLQEEGWGTPHYMAPEQFRGLWRDYGPWTDLYALGVMAYEMACGEQPFRATSQVGYARAHSLSMPGPLKPRFPVPDGFEAWVMRLLQKAPEDRFQRAADAAWALQLLGDPSESGRPKKTVTLMPIKAPETSGEAAETASTVAEAPGLMRDDLGLEDAPDTPGIPRGVELDQSPTILDRPDTTLLIKRDKGMGSHTLNLAPRALTESSLPIAERYEGDLAARIQPPLPYTWKRPQKPPPSMKLLGAGLGLFGLRTIPLVGREKERDKIWEKLREVRQSAKPQVVMIQGGAGSGKSRLAEWIARRAHEVGSADLYWAFHSPMGGPADGIERMVSRHFGTVALKPKLIRERVREKLGLHGMGEELECDAFTEFVSPTRSATESRVSMTFSTADQRYGLLRRYLAASTVQRPAIVVVDDAQWGSEALSFVRHVLQKSGTEHLPVLFLVTVRQEALAERPVEAAMLEELTEVNNSTTVNLKPLNDGEMLALVRELLYLDGSLAEQVEARCAGNPLFAVQLVGDWVSGGKLQFGSEGFELRPGARAEVPDDIHDLWMGRLERLTVFGESGLWRSLELAAALGREVDHEEWRIAAQMCGFRIPDDLEDSLSSAGLMRPNDTGWSFVHGMLRESLERRAKEGSHWTGLNAACVQMLEARYPEQEFPFAERLARYLVESGQHEEALPWLKETIRSRTDLSDFERASDHLLEYGRILRELKVDGIDPRRGENWLLDAEIQLQQARFDDAQKLAERIAIEARRHGWSRLLPRALVVEGTAELSRGELRHARNTFERARSLYDELNDLDGVARATRGLGRVLQYEGEYQSATELLEESKELFRQGHNLLGVARTLNALGDVARHQGNYRVARSWSEEAMAICDEIGNQIGVADCINDLAELSRLEGDLEAALNSCTRALKMYESLGSDESMFVRINLGLILMQYARYIEARECFEELRAHFTESAQQGLLGAVNVYLLPCLAALGAWEEFQERAEEAREELRRTEFHSPDIPRAFRLAISIARGSNHQEMQRVAENALAWYQRSSETREITKL